MSTRGDEVTDPVLAEMQRQTKVVQDIRSAVMLWLALTILGLVIGVGFLMHAVS